MNFNKKNFLKKSPVNLLKVFTFQQPAYMFDLIAPYIPPRSLGSSNKNLLIVPDMKWAADRFPLLHLPFGTLSLSIFVPRIYYLFSGFAQDFLISKVSILPYIIFNSLNNAS